MLPKNRFIGTDLRDARWYGINFDESQQADFTEADLRGVRVSDDGLGLKDGELLETDKRLLAATFCRTKFSRGVSNRNCPSAQPTDTPDLSGMGLSAKPAGGYDKKTQAGEAFLMRSSSSEQHSSPPTLATWSATPSSRSTATV